MDNQDWKNIIIDEKASIYDINSNGEIRNKDTNRILAQNVNNKGLYKSTILIGQDKHTLYVHKLLAEYFVPNPKNYTIAYHIDGDKSNNKVSNIGWTNRSESVARGHATKKHTKKINQYADADKTQLIATYDSVLDASEKLGIHRTTITKFLTGKRTSDKVFISYA
jgi:hypothetical protein